MERYAPHTQHVRKDVEMRAASIAKEVTLCFPQDKGGDLKIKPGDLVVITVVRWRVGDGYGIDTQPNT